MDRIRITKKFIKKTFNNTSKGLKFKTFGSSMWPLIETGDEIEVIYKDISRLNKGDIIVIENNGKYISHRIIQTQPIFKIKGDNTQKCDRLKINENNYMGTVISIHKKRFNLTLNSKHLRIYYFIFKIFGKNIKYANILRNFILKRKNGKNN